MASATLLRPDQRVSIAGKGVGTIAFVGKTDFADGNRSILFEFLLNELLQVSGLVLFSMNQKGKTTALYKRKVPMRFSSIFHMSIHSDGTTVRYFTCDDNHGLYVRPGQIESVLNDLQSDLVRSSSNHSIKSQGSSTGSIPAPTNSGIPKSSGLPTKNSGLRAPTPSSGAKPPGIE